MTSHFPHCWLENLAFVKSGCEMYPGWLSETWLKVCFNRALMPMGKHKLHPHMEYQTEHLEGCNMQSRVAQSNLTLPASATTPLASLFPLTDRNVLCYLSAFLLNSAFLFLIILFRQINCSS
jgi:hypothetical protein